VSVSNRINIDLDTPNNYDYSLHGDPAYPLIPQILVSFEKEEPLNRYMSHIREADERVFEHKTRLFAFGDLFKEFPFVRCLYNYKIVLTHSQYFSRPR
jgi:hypothetical protein